MGENEIAGLVAFIIWGILGLLLIGIGGYAFRAKKAVGFWANAKTVPIADIRSYNRAVGKMWCTAGPVFIVMGLPLLPGQNTAFIMISVVGMMFGCIALMVIYTRIEAKYRKK